MTEIGIIGFGRFGKLITEYLSEDFRVYVFDREDKSEEIENLGSISATLEDVCNKDVIIPSVPISEFEDTLTEIKDLIKKDSLVIDVCSVKEYPVELMYEILPPTVQILASHPLFGPDSASDSLVGRKIVLCGGRIVEEKYEKIKSYLEKKELVVIETTPEEHDREIAESLLLTHFIGRSLIEVGTSELEIDIVGYNQLLKVLETVKNDSWQLFEDMNKYNKYALEARKKFMGAVNEIDKRLQ